MKREDLAVLDMLSFIYEDMDIDAIEEKFIESVYRIFSFDKVGLFFLKHSKQILQGKLCRGFAPGTISSLEIALRHDNILTKPLVTGFPLWNESFDEDPYLHDLGLHNFAVIPIVNKRRIPCWQLKDCHEKTCPAFGKKWLRCWLVPNTHCSDSREITTEQKLEMCRRCKIFSGLVSTSHDSVEGILLVDNSISNTPISTDTVTILATIAHAVGVAINNSKLYSKTLRDSVKDDLTGLYNRRYFNERLSDELERAKRYNKELSLIMIDIDFFKKINDTYGHPVGDTVLQWFAKTLNEKFRHNDVVARYGGEEFAILLLETNRGQAAKIAELVRVFVEENSPPCAPEIKLTCSFEIAAYGTDSYAMQGLIAKADKALYCAKAQGRNRVCLCGDSDS